MNINELYLDDKDRITYLNKDGTLQSVATIITNKIKENSTDDELSYIINLIKAMMESYKDNRYLLDELLGTTQITKTLNELYDLKMKIISYLQIVKE